MGPEAVEMSVVDCSMKVNEETKKFSISRFAEITLFEATA
jgi:hypothetical protein